MASPVLAVRTVTVEGAGVGTAEVLTTIGSTGRGPVGVPLARVDVSDIARGVAALPWVKQVTVSRSYPGSLLVHVSARVAVAAVAYPPGSVTLVDATGVPFETRSDYPPGLPVLLVGPGPVNSTTVSAGVAVLSELPATAASQIAQVRAITPDDVRLVLRSGTTVLWGGPGNGALKARLLVLLSGPKVARLDLRAPDAPAVLPKK